MHKIHYTGIESINTLEYLQRRLRATFRTQFFTYSVAVQNDGTANILQAS